MLRSRTRIAGLAARHVRGYASSPLAEAFKSGEDETQSRYRTQRTPAPPSLQALDKRWLKMDAGQQDDVIAYLEDKMRLDWKDMTVDEKRAAWFVWFGNWGPRTRGPRDMASLYTYFGGSVVLFGAGLALYKFSTFDPEHEVPGIKYD